MKTITYDETKCQLVPKEMTEEMGKAGANEWLVSNSQLDWYRALLSAAPQPPSLSCNHSYHYFGDYPVRRCNNCNELETAAPQPVVQEEQKPVAEVVMRLDEDGYPDTAIEFFVDLMQSVGTKLYTSPPSSVQAYNEGLEAAAKYLNDNWYAEGFDDHAGGIRALKKTQDQQVAPDDQGEEK